MSRIRLINEWAKNSRNDTTNYAKIHKSEVSNRRGGRQPKMGRIGPAPGSAEPILVLLDAGLRLDGVD